MEKSKVYFTDFHTQAYGDGLPTKLKKLIKRAGIQSLNLEGKFVAIKMHFGELGNVSYLRSWMWLKNWGASLFLQTAIPCTLGAEKMPWSIWNVHGRTVLPL